MNSCLRQNQLYEDKDAQMLQAVLTIEFSVESKNPVTTLMKGIPDNSCTNVLKQSHSIVALFWCQDLLMKGCI
jgi:hypothetical protein